MAAAPNWIGGLRVKFKVPNLGDVMQHTKNFLCVDVDTIYGYYQSRFGSLGPSYKGEIFNFRPNFDKLPNPVECKLNFLT